ncbi:MAG: hypothetical protein P8X79_01430 [Reinekea sp.]
MKPTKRHALAVVLVNTQLAQAYDDLADLLTRVISDIEQDGKKSFQADLFDSRDRANGLISQFREVLDAYQSTADIQHASLRLEKIEAAFSTPPDELLTTCDSHLASVVNDERPHIVNAYGKKRKLLFEIFEQLPIEVDVSCRQFLALGNRLFSEYQSASKELQLSINIHDDVFELLPSGWDIMIFPEGEQEKVNRFSLEAAWFIALKAQLKTFNCYVVGGQKYGDPNQQLISWDEYTELASEYQELSDIPVDGHELVKHLKTELADIARKTDDNFPNIKGALIQDDKLVLRRAYTKYKSDTLDGLRNAIKQHMPKASIIDVLTDTVRWLGLEKIFRPQSGHDSKLTN